MSLSLANVWNFLLSKVNFINDYVSCIQNREPVFPSEDTPPLFAKWLTILLQRLNYERLYNMREKYIYILDGIFSLL